MPKEEWGVKRVCPTTGKRFYDLGKSPVVSPYTGEVVNLDTARNTRTMVADKSEAKPAEDDDIVIEDDDIDTDADDLDDELLEDDDDDNVSLDDIADVSDDDEN
jgi:hypothetical protein